MVPAPSSLSAARNLGIEAGVISRSTTLTKACPSCARASWPRNGSNNAAAASVTAALCSTTDFSITFLSCPRRRENGSGSAPRSVVPERDLPPLVKMMHRAVAGADLDLVGRGDRGADIGLGLAHRRIQRKSLGEAGGDRRRQGAAGTVSILGCNTRRGKTRAAVGLDPGGDAV